MNQTVFPGYACMCKVPHMRTQPGKMVWFTRLAGNEARAIVNHHEKRLPRSTGHSLFTCGQIELLLSREAGQAKIVREKFYYTVTGNVTQRELWHYIVQWM